MGVCCEWALYLEAIGREHQEGPYITIPLWFSQVRSTSSYRKLASYSEFHQFISMLLTTLDLLI